MKSLKPIPRIINYEEQPAYYYYRDAPSSRRVFHLSAVYHYHMIQCAQGQPQIARVRSAPDVTQRASRRHGTKTFVEFTIRRNEHRLGRHNKIQLYQSWRSIGHSCGVDPCRARPVAPNTNGGTLNPVAFANPSTVNASRRVAFNSQVEAQTVTRVYSSLIQTVRSARSLVAAASRAVAEIQLRCAVMLHHRWTFRCFFCNTVPHLILMMQAT